MSQESSEQSLPYHKIWIEQCWVVEHSLLPKFGAQNILDYLVGEKFVNFVEFSEKDPLCAAEVPAFAAEIRRLFTPEELRDYAKRKLSRRRPTWRFARIRELLMVGQLRLRSRRRARARSKGSRGGQSPKLPSQNLAL